MGPRKEQQTPSDELEAIAEGSQTRLVWEERGMPADYVNGGVS